MTNDTMTLVPKTGWDGPSLAFDFPAMQIGIAEHPEGPTGCTVFHFPAGAACVMDVRGGSPGFVGDYGFVHAICLAGGSLYGLEAATGVVAELFAMRGYSANWMEIALVSGAIIFDYGPRDNTIYPDKTLGRAALRAARTGIFPLGGRGAGCSARVGAGFDWDQGELAGQGGAFRQVGATKIAVFSVVVTNQRVDVRALRQIGWQVHSSMARAIQPFHTMDDGDVLFTVTTNEAENAALGPTALGLLASELAWDAVLSSFAGRTPYDSSSGRI